MYPPSDRIDWLLGQVRHRRRVMTRGRHWSVAALSVSAVLAVALVLHWALGLAELPFVLLWGGVALAIVTVAVLAVVRRPVDPGDAQLARFVEERCPECEDVVATAVALRRPGQASPAVDAVLADAANRAATLDLDRIVHRRDMRGATWRALLAAAALAALALTSVSPARDALRWVELFAFPERLGIVVQPGDARARAGTSLRIAATLSGAPAGVAPVLVVGSDSPREVAMARDGDRFVATLERLEATVRYSVTAASSKSREYKITVLRPPSVTRIDLHYEYPRVLGMPSHTAEDGGDIYGPAGTTVRVSVHSDKPAASGALVLGDGRSIDLAARGHALEGTLTIAGDDAYRVRLVDEDGLDNDDGPEYFIRTLTDRPPVVRIVRPGGDRKVTRVEEVLVEAQAEDDHGIRSFDLVYAVRGGAEQVVPLERAGEGLAVTGRRLIYLEELELAPGDFVTYYARAHDVARGKRSSEARSDIYFLEVTPFNEEFVAAQMRGGAGNQEEQSLEQLVKEQKEIIAATWTLDRRRLETGRIGRDDIRALAVAQGDLRRRAVSVALQMQRVRDVRQRRPQGGRGAQAANPSAEATRRAADAMGLAQQRLETMSTSTALPHEMTALNELLRAAAESRRRQVQLEQQQTSSGSGGENRQQQDLSSLFDRELARQQQTNYETPSTSETRDTGSQRDRGIERVRELARRQEALNREEARVTRRQDDDGARRRQLERLGREQDELRRQAEELARQLRQQEAARGREQTGSHERNTARPDRPDAGRATTQAQAAGQFGRELERAAAEMRGAAADLRRHDSDAGSARGERALDRLEALERQMRATNPEERRRALGDAQLESRQLADAQRRLARDGRGAPAPDDARSRAAEQRRLAERMSRLEESVRQLADDGVGPTVRVPEPLRQAARELGLKSLSGRMHQLARNEQTDASRQGEAATIARDLERLGDQLEASGQGDDKARQRVEEMARLRDLREQLAETVRDLGRGSAENEGSGVDAGRSAGWDGARELLERMRRDLGYRTPETAAFSPGQSAPGTEAWKQDFARWERLHVHLSAAIEDAERDAVARHRAESATDRLHPGTTPSVPDRYRLLVDDYYKALAVEGRR